MSRRWVAGGHGRPWPSRREAEGGTRTQGKGGTRDDWLGGGGLREAEGAKRTRVAMDWPEGRRKQESQWPREVKGVEGFLVGRGGQGFRKRFGGQRMQEERME